MAKRNDKPTVLVTQPEIKCVRKIPVADPKLIYPYGRYSEQEYLQSLVGKNIIVVGPAGYLKEQNKGSWIDSFDMVVRINHALPILFPEDYGTKTDILYHILSHRGGDEQHKELVTPDEVTYWKTQHLKWLISSHGPMSNRAKEIGPIINGEMPWACVNDRFSERIKVQVGMKSPNTGITAIVHLLSSQIKSLTITGFDFYSSGVYKGYGDVKDHEDALTINNIWHDIEAQKAFMRRLIARENRLRYDDVLAEVLEYEYGAE